VQADDHSSGLALPAAAACSHGDQQAHSQDFSECSCYDDTADPGIMLAANGFVNMRCLSDTTMPAKLLNLVSSNIKEQTENGAFLPQLTHRGEKRNMLSAAPSHSGESASPLSKEFEVVNAISSESRVSNSLSEDASLSDCSFNEDPGNCMVAEGSPVLSACSSIGQHSLYDGNKCYSTACNDLGLLTSDEKAAVLPSGPSSLGRLVVSLKHLLLHLCRGGEDG
jgi:hypothetical protein